MTLMQKFKLLVVWGSLTFLALELFRAFPAVVLRSGARGLLLVNFQDKNPPPIPSRLLVNASQLEEYPKCLVFTHPNVNKEFNTTTKEIPIKPLCLSDVKRTPPTVVLFTTAHDNTKNRNIYESTIRLRNELADEIKSILFVSDAYADRFLFERACHAGWDVYLAPTCNEDRLPALPAMFELVKRQYTGVEYYGYANADMQFDGGLVKTLKALQRFSFEQMPKMLLFGRRRNLKVSV
jgi:hypothetical protein